MTDTGRVADYRATVYEVYDPPVAFGIDAPCQGLIAFVPPGGTAAFLTAWNPRGAKAGDNRSRQHAMESGLLGKGYALHPGVGSSPDRRWREESVLVVGMGLAEAIDVARRFGQEAFVWIDGRHAPVLVLVDEHDAGPSAVATLDGMP